ncbi:MAG: phosphatidate cytidylyltransferase [Ignavibacteriales bacterium]
MKFSNRITRIIVSVLAIPVLLAISIVGKIPFFLMMLLISVIAFNEYSKMLSNKRIIVNRFIGTLAIIAVFFQAYFKWVEVSMLILSITLLLLLIELFHNKQSAINNLGGTLLGVFFIGMFSSTTINIREFYGENILLYNQGGYLISSIFITIWMCDSAAYFLGTAFGKHRLFLRVSPKKSWEGAIAGFIFSIISMSALKIIILDFFSWQDVIIIGIIIGIFGQIGDLVESLMKRDAGVKDSSSIIPGHGGILDRFDSLIFVAPIIYFYLYFFVKY